MNTLQTFLSGKKTYLSALIGLLYLAGVWAGLYEFDETVLGALGLAGLAFLRSGVAKTEPERRLNLAPLAALPLAFALAGCSAVSPGNDPLVVNAERTTELAVDTFDLFLRWEHDNRAVLASVPQIRKAADRIRMNAPTWLTSARSLTKAYKANRSPENRANLETALTVLRTALAEARTYLEHGLDMAEGPPMPPGF